MSKSHWEWTKLKEYRRFFFIILCNKYEIKTTKNGHTHTYSDAHAHTHTRQSTDRLDSYMDTIIRTETDKKMLFLLLLRCVVFISFIQEVKQNHTAMVGTGFFLRFGRLSSHISWNFFQSYSCARQFLELSFHIHTNESNQLSLCKTDSLAISVSFGLEINKTWL